jgi:hypothetical protein
MIAFPTDSQTRPAVFLPERVPESSPGLTFDLRVHQDVTYSTIFSLVLMLSRGPQDLLLELEDRIQNLGAVPISDFE